MKVYQTKIPVGVKAAEVSARGESIFSYDKNGTVAKAYENLTKEVIRDGEKRKDRVRASEVR